MNEFERINDRGGVLGAMETMYQRGRIQEESMIYEQQKHSGTLPVIGVNTFLGADGEEVSSPVALMRSTTDEKDRQIKNLRAFLAKNKSASSEALVSLQNTARENGNLFAELLECVKNMFTRSDYPRAVRGRWTVSS